MYMVFLSILYFCSIFFGDFILLKSFVLKVNNPFAFYANKMRLLF